MSDTREAENMLNVQQSTIVVKILAKVQAQLTGDLPRGTYKIPTSETLIVLAKDLGFIEGRRGRAGGFEATDEGLAFAGIDIKEFRTREAMANMESQQERQAQARKAREERNHMLTEALQSMSSKEA